MPDNEKSPATAIVLIVIAVVVLGACFLLLNSRRSAAPANVPAAGATYRIAVIPKGTTHDFWKSIHAGAEKAKRELVAGGARIDLIWKGPIKEDDRAGQIDVVRNFVGQGINGIVLAPLDNHALVAPVEEAVAAKIPVVIIDSGLESTAHVSFVATNNFSGGQKAAERLAEVIAKKGKIIMLRYQRGSASTEQREAGFLDAIKRFPEIEVVSSDQEAGATRDSALTASQVLLNRFGSKIQGVFTPNESSTAGMALAMQDGGFAKTVKHVGFDTSAPLIEALRDGRIQGLVAQDPFQMGYLGVKHLFDALTNKAVPKQVDTPVQLVTPENINEPAIKSLIDPPLKEYLGE